MKRLFAILGVFGGLVGLSVSHLFSAVRTNEPAAPPTLVQICHMPGTPAEQELMVSPSAVAGHLGHGDKLGCCDCGPKGR